MTGMARKVQCQIVTTTFPSRAGARTLARRLVEARLAACVQLVPIHSLYRWKNAVESAAEIRLEAKTTVARAPAVVAFIRRHHPYELPEIVVQPIAGGAPDYLAWIAAESTP